jgi:hypothetical protein
MRVASNTELGCLQGAEKFLTLPDPSGATTYYAVDVLFATEAQAPQFERSFEGDVGQIQAFCLD